MTRVELPTRHIVQESEPVCRIAEIQ